MRILGIESSCDDTSVALLDCSEEGHFIIAEKSASQINIHSLYGGVVPEIAGRLHAESIMPLIENVTEGHSRPEAIAVTAGPGLITGLIVGVTAARMLSSLWRVPLVGVNHIMGHIHSAELGPPAVGMPDLGTRGPVIAFPALALVVSGGHTELILLNSHTECRIIGRTIDDAAGECFDKVGKLLGFTYPGGPLISRTGQGGNTGAIDFPRPLLNREGYDFSFSGLKTAALYWLRDHKLAAMPMPTDAPQSMAEALAPMPTGPTIADFCASFEQAIVDVLIAKTMRAAQEFNPRTIIVAGGVSANQTLRDGLQNSMQQSTAADIRLLTPPLPYCMDNGAMIAAAGSYQATSGMFTPWQKLGVDPNWKADMSPAWAAS